MGFKIAGGKDSKQHKKALTRAFERMKNDKDLIPVWWPTGRTVQIPKTKDLSKEQKYRPIMCLNTSHKIMTGLIGKYMREHALAFLAVTFYDYQKAYDKVHYDWMVRVYEWIGIPTVVISLLRELMNKWRTRLGLWKDGEKCVSRWIDIECGFLQGDGYSPVGFCITEIPVAKLLEQSKGYRMGEPGKRDISRTHCLFVDDLKVYQE